MKSVAVLCRGKSLQYIPMIPEVDEYIIVNRFGDELEIEYLSSRLMGKQITQILSLVPEEPQLMLERDHYRKFDIKKIILPYIAETVPGAPIPIQNKSGNIPWSVLSDNLKPYMYSRNERPDGDTRYAYSFPTSGLAGVGYATVDLDVDDIYIIGLDFYDTGYAYGKEFESDEVAIRRGENPNMMKSFFTEFVKKSPKKNYKLYTCSSYNEKIDNLTVYNLEK